MPDSLLASSKTMWGVRGARKNSWFRRWGALNCKPFLLILSIHSLLTYWPIAQRPTPETLDQWYPVHDRLSPPILSADINCCAWELGPAMTAGCLANNWLSGPWRICKSSEPTSSLSFQSRAVQQAHSFQKWSTESLCYVSVKSTHPCRNRLWSSFDRSHRDMGFLSSRHSGAFWVMAMGALIGARYSSQ